MSNTNKELNNVQLNVTFVPASIRENIVSGENISTSFGKLSKLFSDLKSIAYEGHPTVTQNDTTSTVSPKPEETFTVVDSVARNSEGHITGINTKTVKLPTGSGYVHPTYSSYSSGLYKVEVDELGHVSGATTVTKSDITSLGIPSSNTLNTAGATDTSSKIYLIGATSQSYSSTTYSHDTVYVGTDGCLYNNDSKVLTEHPTITTSTDTTSTASPAHGGTFTVIDTLTRDTNGHVTKVNTKTVTLPSQYSHPTYTSKSSGLYKITVDTTGHISATSSVTKSDIPSLDYISSTTTRSTNLVLAGPSSGSAAAPTFRTLVTADLPASGATAGSYGPSANASPAHSGTFSVPYITINAKGQVTAASTKTITLPASVNTDTKVNVTLGKTTKAYLLGTSTTPTSTATGVTAIADTGVYLDTTAGKLTATTFAGALSGNATSASKLATARTITLGGEFTGSASFDGSSDITISGSLKRGFVADDATDYASYPWRKIAETTMNGTYQDANITFLVTRSYQGDDIGILRGRIRTGSTKGTFANGGLSWILLTDKTSSYINPDNFVMVYTANSGTSLTAEIWVKTPARYNAYMFTVLDESGRTYWGSLWEVYTNSTRASKYTSGTGVITSSVNTLQNTTYTKLLYSGTGSSSITINDLTSSIWDTFTVVVKDGGSGYTHNIRANKDEYTRYCVPTTPGYNTTSTETGLLSIGVAINMKTNTVEVGPSKYIITASSTTPSAETHNRTFTIEKVYGHKYYYS